MSTSSFGLKLALRTALPMFTTALYTLQDLASGANMFGIVLPGSTPTPTETAYTRIYSIRNLANGAIGLAMMAYL